VGRTDDIIKVKGVLRYDIEFHAYDTLPRYAVKARRFKDLRKQRARSQF
jgi:phenylacetate-CoA ligase